MTAPVMVRFWAQTDDVSSISALGLAWVDALARAGLKVRVLAADVANFANPRARWARVRHLLVTPMASPFVNIVCTDLRGTRPESFWAELWTAGVKNILITDLAEPHELAARYDAIVVCPQHLGPWMAAHGDKVFDLDPTDLAAALAIVALIQRVTNAPLWPEEP